jgi:hypothetical protein
MKYKDLYKLGSQGQLLIVGHGLKDIGGKESFIICIRRDIAPDLLKETAKAFDARWNSATSI